LNPPGRIGKRASKLVITPTLTLVYMRTEKGMPPIKLDAVYLNKKLKKMGYENVYRYK
jgi:hypothetical protein